MEFIMLMAFIGLGILIIMLTSFSLMAARPIYSIPFIVSVVAMSVIVPTLFKRMVEHPEVQASLEEADRRSIRETCIDGVMYLKFNKSLTAKIGEDGKAVFCEEEKVEGN